ncbi:MAG: glycosyl hydrolase, partial [Chloroflexi bacterium]|nr:glycosyl hydrolase [Chloroflexota bacterium]
PVVYSYRQKELPTNQKKEKLLDAGENPPDGVVIYYWLKDKPEGEITLAFTDESGKVIREFTSKKEEEHKDDPRAEKNEEEDTEPHPTKEVGANRFVWNLRYADATKIPKNKGRAGTDALLAGPQVAPGTYKVQLKVGDQTLTQSFDVHKDPRVTASDADLIAQRDLLLQVRDKLSETHDTILQIRHIRDQANAWAKYVDGNTQNSDAVKAAAKKLSDELCTIEDELIQIRSEDPRSFPSKLNSRLAALSNFADAADSRPPQQVYDVFDDLSQRIDAQLARYQKTMNDDIAAFNQLCRESGVGAILAKVKTASK